MKLAKNSSTASVVKALNEAVEKNNEGRMREIVKHIIKTKGGHTYFARKTHVSRQTVYNYLSGRSSMSFDFFRNVLKEIGFRLTIEQEKH